MSATPQLGGKKKKKQLLISHQRRQIAFAFKPNVSFRLSQFCNGFCHKHESKNLIQFSNLSLHFIDSVSNQMSFSVPIISILIGSPDILTGDHHQHSTSDFKRQPATPIVTTKTSEQNRKIINTLIQESNQQKNN